MSNEKNWMTISEIAKSRGISRHKIVYWLTHLRSQGLARKTGDGRCDPWLVHEDAISFLKENHTPGRKRMAVIESDRAVWQQVFAEKRSVQGTANHFGVVWQTAARRLDLYGIRHYYGNAGPDYTKRAP